MKPKSIYEADLHCHTTASDGSLSPREVIMLAVEKKLKVIAITDHDTIEGWDEAEKASKESEIQLLKGIEINTDWEGKEIHILGYGLDHQNSILQNQLLEIQQMRIQRIKAIIEKLNQLGNQITLAEVMHFAKGQSVGRPHVAQAMIKHNLVATTREAFDQYLKRGARAYVPRYKLTPNQAIEIIREANGVAVIAHPGTQNVTEVQISKWVEKGLQGIEVYHPDHTFQDNINYGRIAHKLGLLIAGGSDFHGPATKPGIDLGSCGVGLEDVQKILRMISK